MSWFENYANTTVKFLTPDDPGLQWKVYVPTPATPYIGYGTTVMIPGQGCIKPVNPSN